MKTRGFIPLAVVAIVGLVTVLVTGGGYGVYKYSQIAKEKESIQQQLTEQKDKELEQLRDKVQEYEADEEPITSSDGGKEGSKEVELTSYYIKPATANVRPCTDTSSQSCSPIGQYTRNAEIKLPYKSIAEMPEWLTIEWGGTKAYVSRTVLSLDISSETEESSLGKNKAITETRNTTIDTVVSNEVAKTSSGTLCNGKYWGECPAGQIFTCPQNGGGAYCSPQQSGTNYHYQAVQNVQRIIALNESFKEWLENTEEELRDARKTLNGYPGGGLVGQTRDATLNLVSAELNVISTMISSTNESIVYWQGPLNILNSDPAGFIDKDTFEQIKKPEQEEEEINNVKKKINSTMDDVNDGIQSINDALWSLY